MATFKFLEKKIMYPARMVIQLFELRAVTPDERGGAEICFRVLLPLWRMPMVDISPFDRENKES